MPGSWTPNIKENMGKMRIRSDFPVLGNSLTNEEGIGGGKRPKSKG